MPTPLPPKGTVLQTAEFADSLYSPIFRGTGCALTIPTGASVRLSARVVALYHGCPSLCFYYSTLLAICQALFFVKSYIFPRRYLTRTSWFSGAVFLLPLRLFKEDKPHTLGKPFSGLLTPRTLIVSYFKGFVKRFFQLFLSLWAMTPPGLVEKVSQFPHSHPWGPSVSHFAGYSRLPS